MNIYILLIVTLTVFYGGMILFYHIGWLSLKLWNTESAKRETKVSVIVAARNEEENIGNCMHDLLSQDYPDDNFEVLIVDDFSSDKTAEIAKEISSPNLRLLQLKNHIDEDERKIRFKKTAIEYGIENAGGDLIITTDADCRMGSKWLSTIVSFYESTGSRFIVSPVTFTEDSTPFERMQTLDFLGLMGITGGALAFHFPVMCNGANLAYEKKVFNEVNGFCGHDNLSSGDDVFLMQKADRKYPGSVGYLKNTEAIVSTFPQRTLKDFFHQRLRWTSKNASYSDKRITIILILVYLFNFTIICNALLAFIDSRFMQLLVLQLIVKLVAEFFFLLTVTRFFHRQKLIILFLPAQLLHILYVVVVGLLGNFISYNWKGRKTR